MNEWIPLMDYAMKKGISLSTLRRYIKANKVTYRIENGHYLLLDESGQGGSRGLQHSMQDFNSSSATSAVQHLKTDLQKAHEEIAELKTLIAFYEESLPHHRL